MKYIPGFTFVPGNFEMKSGSILQQQAKKKKILRNAIFKEGVEYKIHHIEPSPENVKYIFLADNRYVEMTFNTIKEAEEKISKVLGD